LRGTVKCGTAIPVSVAVTFAALALVTLKSKAPESMALEFAALEAESLGAEE
jgi:hypothetical protein